MTLADKFLGGFWRGLFGRSFGAFFLGKGRSKKENPRQIQQTKNLPQPLGLGVCKTKSKEGCIRDRRPFMHRVYSAERGIETMVSEGARPWGRGRSASAENPRQNSNQQVLNPTPLNPTPATCHERKLKLRCSFRNAALQKLHCNICFSAARKSFLPKAALQQARNCTATLEKLRCKKVALSCRFPADFKLPRLGTHV